MADNDEKPNTSADESKTAEPEEVHVDKNIDAKETRLAHMCTLCHTQLHKICSTDPKVAIISVAKEGEPKGWAAYGGSATSKTTDSAKSKVDDTKSAKSAVDTSDKNDKTSSIDSSDKKKKTTDESAKTSYPDSSGAGFSGGSGFGGPSKGVGKDKNWKKQMEEEEERKKRKKWEEEEKRRRLLQTTPESTNKPSHEDWNKKKKKEF